MSDILTRVRSLTHDPSIKVYVAGRSVDAIAVTTDTGYDSVSSACQVTLGTVPDWLQFNQDLEILLGYDGFLMTVWKGFVADDGRRYASDGFTQEIRGAGMMQLAQQQYGAQVNYTIQTDKQIIEDLLGTRAGIAKYDVDSDGTTLGNVQDVVLQAGEAPESLISQVDEIFGYKTFDSPDGVVRRRKITGVPANSAAFSYVQGAPGSSEHAIFSISRPRTVRDIHNKVTVTGLPQASGTPSTTRRADNPYTRGKDITYDFQSELIETDAVGSAVAKRLMGEVNRIVEEIELDVPGNPFLQPGMTISITAAQIGLSTATPFFVKHVAHALNDQGFITRLTVEGGLGEAGYELGKPPEPYFTYIITEETWDAVTHATIAADGSLTTDPDSDPSTLSFAWSNNINADAGTALTYATTWTKTQLDSGTASITLVATDGDGNSGTIEQILDGSVDPFVARQLYVAADSQAESSEAGGATWNTFVKADTRATPEIAGEGNGLFGIGDALYSTDDFLAGTPTLAHTFPDDIQSIWVNEVDGDRVSVGLDSGAVYQTQDVSDGTASTWTLLVTMPHAVNHLIESAAQFGQYWVASGNAVWLSFDNLSTKAQHITFDGSATARHIALSGFGNYACSTGGGTADACKREDGVSIVPSDGAADIYTITHHIRDDVLYGAGLSGTSTVIYATSPGATTFDPIGTVAGAGTPHRMIRDGDNQFALYLAAENGLYKSADGGLTWHAMRTGAGPYWQVGYGSAPLAKVTALTVLSGTDALALSLWNTDTSSNDDPPDQWQTADFDDSAWDAAVTFTTNETPVAGTDPIWFVERGANAITGEECLFRHSFTLSAGLVSEATLTIRADDTTKGVWLNNVFLGGFDVGRLSDTIINIDPKILIAGGDNVLAVYGKDIAGGGVWVSYKLVIS